MAAYLLVTVDTEEEFDWDAPVSPRNRSVRHVAELPRLQELFEAEGVRPTYVVDEPIAATDSSVAVLKSFLDRGACEIGAHLHPWVSEPIAEEICPQNTYLCNLPRSLQAEKIGRLTDLIAASFGERPTTFKAGRYGIDFGMMPFFAEQGYTVDTSVIAYTASSDGLGPDFSRFGTRPFWFDGERPTDACTNGVLEVPCTVGFSRRPFRRYARWHQRLSQPKWSRFRAIGILWRLHLMRKITLSPEGTDAADLVRLVRAMKDIPNVVLHVTLHSPSILPGCTPYVRTEEDRARFLRALSAVFRAARRELQAQPLTMAEFRRRAPSLGTPVPELSLA